MTFRLLISFLLILLQIYGSIMSFSIILSWIPGISETKFVRVIRKVADWYLGIFQGKLVVGIFDLTPIIGFMIYGFILTLFDVWL
jgi:uncharacterized protein YggT (Ycf19 family)